MFALSFLPKSINWFHHQVIPNLQVFYIIISTLFYIKVLFFVIFNLQIYLSLISTTFIISFYILIIIFHIFIALRKHNGKDHC